jgi:hypothetical protein
MINLINQSDILGQQKTDKLQIDDQTKYRIYKQVSFSLAFIHDIYIEKYTKPRNPDFSSIFFTSRL